MNMDSENDLHDAYDDDVESIDEYYSDGGNAIHYGDDDADADYDGTDDDCDDMLDDDCDNMLDDDCDNKRDQKQQNYTILKEEDIRRRQEEDTARVSTILSISKEWASILLRNFQWCVNRVHDEWFADEDRVRQTAGLLEIQSVVVPKRPAVTCGICFDHCVHETTHSTPGCGHRYCKDCWERYISISINDGPGCLFLRCPHPGCDAAIYQGMIDKLVSDEDKHKYSQYLYRSYIEGNRNTKWCPAPGCDFAVEFLADGDKKNYDVSCLCSHCFCWNCNEESHRPVDCGTVSKWLIKNSAESENMNWILVNSKSCPKCKRPIEKNHGCMHMTCSLPCKFEFCWLCLGEWSTHDKNTSTFYTCNTYEASRREGTFDVVESRKEMAKQSLERYLHYFERWQTNQSSRKKALADLDQAQTNHIPQLSDTQQTTVSQLMFITEAWLQIIECRRVLKWTYAYGYYIPDHEHAKKEFFEYAQGLAESALERLHQCAENDIRDFLRAEGPAEGFGAFRNKLSGLTSVTNTYFKNLVSALENGLSDVYRGSQTASSKQSRKGKKRSN